jgi:acetyl esterase/lipase
MTFLIRQLLLVILIGGCAQAQAHATAKNPYLIFVHGGAWVSGSPEKYTNLAEALRKQNYCVELARYKLAPGAKHPEPVRELNETILKTARLHAVNCDSSRIYLVGHSAGAHMIAFWNTAYTNSAVKGFVGVEGIYDLPLLLKTWPAYEDQFITAEFGKERESASPSRLTPKSKTPWLIVQSKEDELVDEAQSKVFEKVLLAQKISTQFVELRGDHFGVLSQLEKPDSAFAKALREFVGGLKSK